MRPQFSPQLSYLCPHKRSLKEKVLSLSRSEGGGGSSCLRIATAVTECALARKVGCADKHFFTMSSLLHSYLTASGRVEGREIVPLWFIRSRGKNRSSPSPLLPFAAVCATSTVTPRAYTPCAEGSSFPPRARRVQVGLIQRILPYLPAVLRYPRRAGYE